jgi:hypothetical protein
VPWTAYKAKPNEKTDSVILERKLSDINALDGILIGEEDVLIFHLTAVSEAQGQRMAGYPDHLVNIVNKANNVVQDEESGLIRAYEEELTYYWILVDSHPPIAAENVIATCTFSGIETVGSGCNLIEFSPVANVAVNLGVNSKFVSQYQLIKNDIHNLIKEWQVGTK